MKKICIILYLLASTIGVSNPSFSQTFGGEVDTNWIEPYLLSMKYLIKNGDYFDFFLLDPQVAQRELPEIPDGIYIVYSRSDIEDDVRQNQYATFYYASRVPHNSITEQFVWQLVDATLINGEIYFDKRMIYTLVYTFDGTDWKLGPRAINDIHDTQTNKEEENNEHE